VRLLVFIVKKNGLQNVLSFLYDYTDDKIHLTPLLTPPPYNQDFCNSWRRCRYYPRAGRNMIKVGIRCCTWAAVQNTSKNILIAAALNFQQINEIFIFVAFYTSELHSFLKLGLNFDKSYISFPVVINVSSSQNSLNFKQDKHLPIFDKLIGCTFG